MAAITFEEYQGLAARTANKHENEQVNYAMGLAGESGELIDLCKKFLFHGHSISKDNFKKEAGDVLWYASQLTRIYNIPHNVLSFDRLNKLNETIELVRNKGDLKRLTMISCMNLSKAVGYVVSLIEEATFKEATFDTSNFEWSIRIVLKNVYFLVRVSGLTIEEVAEANIEKLKKRYPEGFSSEASINRPEE